MVKCSTLNYFNSKRFCGDGFQSYCSHQIFVRYYKINAFSILMCCHFVFSFVFSGFHSLQAYDCKNKRSYRLHTKLSMYFQPKIQLYICSIFIYGITERIFVGNKENEKLQFLVWQIYKQ